MGKVPERIAKVINKHPGKLWAITELATEAGVSRQYISQLYKAGKLPDNVLPSSQVQRITIARGIRREIEKSRELGIDAIPNSKLDQFNASRGFALSIAKELGIRVIRHDSYYRILTIIGFACGRRQPITQAITSAARVLGISPFTLRNLFYRHYKKFLTRRALECIKNKRDGRNKMVSEYDRKLEEYRVEEIVDEWT